MHFSSCRYRFVRRSSLLALAVIPLPLPIAAIAEVLPAPAVTASSTHSSSSYSPLPGSADGDFVLPGLSVAGSTNATRVVQHALLENPQVRADWNAIRAAANDTRDAWGGYLPTVGLSGNVGTVDQSGDGRGSYGVDSWDLTLQQMIFDGFNTSSQVERLLHTKRQTYYDFLDTSQQVALDAYKAYLNVKRRRELVALARGNYAQHLTVFDQIQQRASSGAGRGVDLEQITGRLALAESNLMTEAANLHDVVSNYQNVVGELPPRQLAPVPDLAPLQPASVTAALEEALDDNPKILTAIENRMAQRAARRGEQAAFYPEFSLQASTGSGNENGTRGERFDQNSVRLVGSLNLYRGGSDVASWRAAGDRLEQALQQQQQVCYNVRETTQMAYRDAVRLGEQLLYLAQHRQSIDRIRVPYQQQYELGQRTLLDLLDNENEYFQASRDYINGLYDQKVAYARTLAATGRLLSALKVSHLDTSDLVKNVKPDDASVETLCRVASPGGFTLDDLTKGLNNVGLGGSTNSARWPETGGFDVEPLGRE